jgi:hypothetical protein
MEFTMSKDEKTEKLAQPAKRQFLRKIVVGGAVMVVAAGYQPPQLDTLLGPQVAHATRSKPRDEGSKPSYDKGSGKSNGSYDKGSGKSNGSYDKGSNKSNSYDKGSNQSKDLGDVWKKLLDDWKKKAKKK